jgi:cytochrome c-type biogenesis protein CcmE
MSETSPGTGLGPAAPAWLHSPRARWYALGALAAAGIAFAVLTVGGIGKNLVYYWGPTELKNAGKKAVGATIRLGGLVADGSIRRGEGASGIEFDVVDRQGGLTHVRCSGVPPQLFRERIGVVVEGTMTRAGHFEGHRLMISHGNEYRAPTEAESVAVEELMRSVRDGQERTGGPVGAGADAGAPGPGPKP